MKILVFTFLISPENDKFKSQSKAVSLRLLLAFFSLMKREICAWPPEYYSLCHHALYLRIHGHF